MDNSITITVEDLPLMTSEQADRLRRKLKRAARETVHAFLLSPNPKVLIAERDANDQPSGAYTVKDPNNGWAVIAQGVTLEEAERL